MENIKSSEKPIIIMDTCVICGRTTIYSRDTHIDYREYYVEGAGQLCKSCCEKIYRENDDRKDFPID